MKLWGTGVLLSHIVQCNDALSVSGPVATEHLVIQEDLHANMIFTPPRTHAHTHAHCREGHLTVAQLLLQEGAKVNVPSGSENNIPLTLACWKGHRDVVALLLDHASNIEHQNKAGCTPLMLAARYVWGRGTRRRVRGERGRLW